MDLQMRNDSNYGAVVPVRGSVVDVRFERHLPPIFSVLRAGTKQQIVVEVMTQLDARRIRGIALTPTQGLARTGRTGRAVNIKKGQFVSPHDIRLAVEKVASTGNSSILLTERGSSFGYNNLVVDMRGLAIMRGFGYPVIFDATHSVQLPGAAGTSSGGQPEFIEPLASAAVAAGADAVFVEVHEAPERALSDGANALRLDKLGRLMRKLQRIWSAARAE